MAKPTDAHGGSGTKAPLKLLARDAEDLAVLSAFLQDALVDFADMTYLAAERRFAVVCTRFRWEDAAPDDKRLPGERVLCGLSFDGVARVQTRGIDPKRDARRIFELLAVQAGPGEVRLVLAGGAEVRLEAAEIAIRLKDLGEPWPVLERPRHPLED